MFKVFIIVAICALAAAARGEGLTALPATLPLYKSTLIAQPTHLEVHEPALAKLGDVVESVPTAVSHQSSTIVHSKAQHIAPILTPAIRSYTAAALRSISAPPSAAPLLSSLPFGHFRLGPAAAFVHANAPIQVRSFTAPIYRSFGFAYGQPLVYASNEFKK